MTNDPTSDVATQGGDQSFAVAMEELDSILVEIERDDVDVDILASRVARAAELIALCRERIAGARVAVDTVVADLAETEQLDGSDRSESGEQRRGPAGEVPEA